MIYIRKIGKMWAWRCTDNRGTCSRGIWSTWHTTLKRAKSHAKQRHGVVI